MTGLPCEDRVCNPPKAVTFSDFLGMDRCSHDDLISCFRKMKKTSKKKLIIARLLLIEMVVCYRRIDYITEENLSLACDDEKFGQYPWGRQSYEALLKALKKSATMDRKKARPSYELYGYWIAFQVFCFTCLIYPCNQFSLCVSIEGIPYYVSALYVSITCVSIACIP
jgi:hypothetical protein